MSGYLKIIYKSLFLTNKKTKRELDMGILKKMAIFLCLAAALAGLGCLAYTEKQDSQKKEKEISQNSNDLREYQQKKLKLENELIGLEDQIAESKHSEVYVIMDFDHMGQSLHTLVFPLMQEYGFTASFCVSSGNLPGKQMGDLSLDQFKELLGKGWDFYVGAPDAEPATETEDGVKVSDEWMAAYAAQQEGLKECEIATPAVFFDESDNLNVEFIAPVLDESGYQVVYKQDNSLHVLKGSLDYVDMDLTSLTPGFESEKILPDFASAEESPDYVIHLGYVSATEKEGMIAEETFRKFLEELKGKQDQGQIRVVTLGQYYQKKAEINQEIKSLQETYDSRKAEIQSEIEEIDTAIDRILKKGGADR